MFFRQVKDDRLAQYAYIVGSTETGEALVIDPERDVDRYVRIAAAEGLSIVAVAETHIHADFLSGARELAERYGAKLYLSGEGGPDWQSRWALDGDYDLELLHDGSTFVAGGAEVTVVHTPGHTPEHLTLLLRDASGHEERPVRAVTGDFVFVGDLGRPDLLESAAGLEGMMESSARALYRSVRRAMEWPEDLQIWPGHGAGSACGKALGEAPVTTWGTELASNAAVRAASLGEQGFVDYILEGQPEPPLYFARMKRLNRDGVPVVGEISAPARMSANDLVSLQGRPGIAVVDTRADRAEYLAAHVPRSIYAPLDEVFHTVVGSYVDPEATVYLVAQEREVDELALDLARIGYDDVGGWLDRSELGAYAGLGGPMVSTPSVGLAEAPALLEKSGTVALDVRTFAEFETEQHLPGAINVAHTRLPDRLDELPRDGRLLVSCASGRRASRAASLLEREGFEVVVVESDGSEGRDASTDGAVTAA